MSELAISNIQMFFGLAAVTGALLSPLYAMVFMHGKKITDLCVNSAVQQNQYKNDHPHEAD